MDFCLLFKYSQKRLDSAKKITTNAIKSASKISIQQAAEATGGLIGNKIADKITAASTELHSMKSFKELHPEKDEANNEIPKERYISSEKRKQIIDKLRLV